MEGYEAAYVNNDSTISQSQAAITVGQKVIDDTFAQYGTPTVSGNQKTLETTRGDVTIKLEQETGKNAKITLTTRDKEKEGTININGGTLSWGIYTSYTMGQTVTLGGEEFWVIEDSDANTATVKLLAKLNVITTEGDADRYKQNASANKLRFDDYSNVYYDDTTNPVTQAEIKTHVDAYKTAVEGRWRTATGDNTKTIQEARLMTGTNSSGEVQAILGSALTNKRDIVYGPEGAKLNYWLGTPSEFGYHYEWLVFGNYGLEYNMDVTYDGTEYSCDVGLRPVLVVLKSNI
ncbi:MAG: hypothetical protein J5881_00735 [Clostridia bacterium]|nr:hypothetical protein [Clostridia bacterium]